MSRQSHPARDRALYLMREGLATPDEIATVLGIKPDLVRSWRYRAKIHTRAARLEHVHALFNRPARKPPEPVLTDDPAF